MKIRLAIALIGSMMSSSAIADRIVIGVADSNKGALEYANGKFEGKFAAPFQCIVDGLEHKPRIKVRPVSRLFTEFHYGKLDVIMPMARTPRREHNGLFARPMAEVPFVLFAKKDYPNLNNFNGDTIASIPSAASNEFLADDNANVIEVDTYQQSAEMVLSGRADGFVVPAPVVPYMSKVVGDLNKWVYHKAKVSMYITKRKPELLDTINALINKCLPQEQKLN